MAADPTLVEEMARMPSEIEKLVERAARAAYYEAFSVGRLRPSCYELTASNLTRVKHWEELPDAEQSAWRRIAGAALRARQAPEV